MFQVFSSLAGIGGDDDGNLDAYEIEEPVATAYMSEVMPLSVNDDLADYIEVPPIYIDCGDLPAKFYGNTISGLSGNKYVYWGFNSYVANNISSLGGYDIIYELTFSDGYNRDSIGVTSSDTAITGNVGFGFSIASILASGSNGKIPCTGFSYVDDNTIRISYSYTYSASSGHYIDSFMGFRLDYAAYLRGNSVTCRLYMRPSYIKVSVNGGDGGGGSGGGGAAT